ncbi:hypothetical protein G6023_04890 [Dietzia sp. DQ11-71]|nr:hypothetical protein [Dietzia sp. DQ11-71]
MDRDTAERFEQVVADETHPSALRRIIAEQTADMVRALDARAVDAAEAG